MKPSDFKYANKTLMSPMKCVYGLNVDGSQTKITSLRVWTDNRMCVSLWRMSLMERLSALLFGKVWLAILSGGTCPPVYVAACREYLVEKKEK